MAGLGSFLKIFIDASQISQDFRSSTDLEGFSKISKGFTGFHTISWIFKGQSWATSGSLWHRVPTPKNILVEAWRFEYSNRQGLDAWLSGMPGLAGLAGAAGIAGIAGIARLAVFAGLAWPLIGTFAAVVSQARRSEAVGR